MDDLVRWLGEQLDEDEQIAREASGWLKPAAYWSLDEWFGREEPHSLIAQGSPQQPVVGGHFTADPVPTVQAKHIVRHDPARVLREIDAKRRTLVRCQEALLAASPMLVHFAKQTAWEMAQPYSERPGFTQEWAP